MAPSATVLSEAQLRERVESLECTLLSIDGLATRAWLSTRDEDLRALACDIGAAVHAALGREYPPVPESPTEAPRLAVHEVEPF